MKPIIGLVPLWDDARKSYWMLPGYMKVLERCGAMPVMLPLTQDADSLSRMVSYCDGVVLTGGQDVSPRLYHETPSPACGPDCEALDLMEALLIPRLLHADVPTLGICRGLQIMNAVLGGTLYQDLPTERPSSVVHHMTAPYDRAVHTVSVVPHTPMSEILNAPVIGVNSYHHQAIRRLAPDLKEMAISEDGLVEAVFYPGKRFFIGVQWHPEFSYASDANSIALVRAFVDAAAAGRQSAAAL